MTDNLPLPTPDYTVPPLPGTRSAQIGALRTAGRFAIGGFAVLIGLAAIDLVVTPLAVSAVTVAEELAVIVTVLAVAQLGTVLATAAAFLTWLYLAMKNLRTWHITGHGWSPGWAIGGWFIPLANLVIPPMVVNSAMRGSDTPANSTYAPSETYGLVWGWWITFVISGCAQNAASRTNFVGQDIASVAFATGIGTVLYIVAAAQAIAVVRRITGLQERRQAALDASWQGLVLPGA